MEYFFRNVFETVAVHVVETNRQSEMHNNNKKHHRLDCITEIGKKAAEEFLGETFNHKINQTVINQMHF